MPDLGSGFRATESYPVPAALYDALVKTPVEGVKVWNGTTAFPAVAEGTEEDPVKISTPEELAYVILNGGGGYYKLTSDIYLNDPDMVDWSTGTPVEGYTPNEWYNSNSTAVFSGTIDGDGHIIYGLYYKRDSGERTDGNYIVGYGLIPSASNADIIGLGIDKSYLEAYTNYSFGTFIGNGQSNKLTGSMSECYVGSQVTVKGYDTGLFIGGGSIGSAGFTFTDCYSLGNLDFSHRGGLVGDAWTSHYSFERVYTLNGKLMGNGTPKSSKNAYANLDEGQMTGKVTDGNTLVLGDAFVATESYPVLKAFAGEREGWNGLAEPFTVGDGASESTAYEISTLGQLAHAVALGGGKYYKLVSDIYINDVEKINWSDGTLKDNTYTPNTWFYGTDTESAKYNGFSSDMTWSGTLDGNGHTVYGLWYSPDFSGTGAGLIPGVSSGTVKNLSLSDSYVVGGRFIGAIASTFAGKADGVVADETVTVIGKKNVVKDSYATGGLFGYTNGITISNCAFYGKLSGYNHVYGLVGTSWGSRIHATNCFAIGYQPFTTSVGVKKYTTQEDADANYQTYYGNLYQVNNVYTDTHARNNTVTYKYDSDGVDTDSDENLEYDVSQSYTVFEFTVLAHDQITGSSSLTNMSAMDGDFWYATDTYPRTYYWARSNGDLDLDGKPVLSADILAIRNHILGTKENSYADMNGDGDVNVCDLVKAWNSCPQRYKINGETYI